MGHYCATLMSPPVPCPSGTYSWAASTACEFHITVSTLAGSDERTLGSADGLGTNALFSFPQGMVLGPDGHLYVADPSAAIVKRVSLTGLVTTVAGSANNPGTADGVGTASQFQEPNTVCFSPDGALVVADKTCLRRVTPSGQVSTWVGDPNTPGYRDGNGTQALFQPGTYVAQMAMDAAGNLVYPDWANNVIRVVSPAGDVRSLCRNGTNSTVFTVQTNCGATSVMGDKPWSVYIDPAGNHYYTHLQDASPIDYYRFRNAVSFRVHQVFGPWSWLCSVIVDAIGAVYAFDCPRGAGRIFVLQPNSGRVLPLVGGDDGFADGRGTQVRFGAFGSNVMVFDDAGHMYGRRGLVSVYSV
jgi:sugar lactone lactonase YvrE